MTSPRSSNKKRPLRLQLFIAGDAPNSVSALRNLRTVLTAHAVEAELEIIDVMKRPELGLRANVLVTPTMIRLAPPVERRIIGNLQNKDALLSLLELAEERE